MDRFIQDFLDSAVARVLRVYRVAAFRMRGQVRYRPLLGVPVRLQRVFHRRGARVIDPELFQERVRPGGQPLKLRYYALLLPPIVHWCIAGLDVGRFHWSDSVPPILQIVGLAIFALALALIIWAMRINRFFSSVIRLQEDRGHELVTGGPYRWVRHPGYIAGFLILPRRAESHWARGFRCCLPWRACRYFSAVPSPRIAF